MTYALSRASVPGAVVAIVDSDSVVLAKGYGMADLESDRAMEPDRTLLRVGSLSKWIVAVAVLQLRDRGLLRLDGDIREYIEDLDAVLPGTTPVTVAHLLTHTAGYEDIKLVNVAGSAEEVGALEEYVLCHAPKRVRPSGDVFSYSNYGYALAGHMVAMVSGRPFEEYASSEIFGPLGMTTSSFAQEPSSLVGIAKGYMARRGQRRPVPYQYVRAVPAGALVTTASDMARLMICCLGQGAYGDRRILSESSANDLLLRQFSHHRRLPGTTYGFIEDIQSGRRTLLLDGEILGFWSRTMLVPESRTGLFVAVNQDVVGGAGPRLFQTLRSIVLEWASPDPPSAYTGTVQDHHSVGSCDPSGSYVPVRRSHSTFEKLGMLGRMVTVRPRPDGTYLLWGDIYHETDSLFFESFSGGPSVAFRKDERGGVSHMFRGITAYERVRWFESARFQGAVLVVSLLVLLTAPVASLARRRGGMSRSGGHGDRLVRNAYFFAAAVLVLVLLLVAGAGFLLAGPTAHRLLWDGTVRKALQLLLILPWIGAACTACFLGLYVRIVVGRAGRAIERVHLLLIAFAAMAIVWLQSFWRVLGSPWI